MEEETVYRYSLVETIESLDSLGTQIEPLSNALGFLMRGSINHVVAKNHWDVESEAAPAATSTPPQIDYETLIFTGRVQLSERLKVYWWVPGAWASQTGRVKLIEVPEAIFEYVVPGTVIDVEEGELIQHEGGGLRSDYSYLQGIAAQAAMWHASVRASVSWTQPKIRLGFPVGALVEGMEGPEGITMIGSPITRVAWNFEDSNQMTSVSTGFEELDYRRGAHMGLKG